MKYLTAFLLLFSTSVLAEPLREVYTQYAENVQIVLTNQPCVKWETPEGVQLNYAYAVKTDTGAKVTGCFTHDDKHIIIQLSDDAKNHYEFKISPDAFKPRSNI